MSITADIRGHTSEPVEFGWTPDDVMLYAVAVGAGGADPTDELALTTENTRGVELSVLPTFAYIVTRGAPLPFEADLTKLVHAAQEVELAGPLPTSGRATVTAEVTEVFDKGSGALVTTERRAVDADTGAPLATGRQTVFIRDAGGFGGERGPSSTWTAPDRAPDATVSCPTRPEQALLYRLTGDHNPLHTDPAFAARAGFERPILHGMCTYGIAGRALVARICGGDPTRVRAISARFTRPVTPGDELSVSIWEQDDAMLFTTSCGSEVVLDQGRLVLA